MRERMIILLVLSATALWGFTAAATTPRFVVTVSGGRTVFDQQTSLEWAEGDTPAGSSWVDALSHCDLLDFGGHTDWRLPNLTELASLVDETREDGPAIHSAFFTASGFAIGPYWSSTTHPANTATAYVVWFNDTGNELARGGVSNVSKGTSRNAICVR